MMLRDMCEHFNKDNRRKGPAMKNWKTIDSAPRDGTKVLLFVMYDAASSHFDMKVGHFSRMTTTEPGRSDDRRDGWRCGETFWRADAPSHWMPLPFVPNVE